MRGSRLAALALLVGCTTQPSFESTTHQIYHGAPEAGSPWTVAVIYQRPSNGRLRLCTGSLIASDVVLTAKHCIFDEDPEDTWSPVPLDAFTVAVTNNVQAPEGAEEVVGVTEVWSTPGAYASPQALGGEDIALLRLNVPLSVVPAEISRQAPVEGQSVRLIGFGFTEDDVLGQKYAGEATIRAFDRGVFETEGDSWTCTGDSGGPAVSADGLILGVSSTGPRGCTVDDSYFTRVDQYAEAIDLFLGIVPLPDAALPDSQLPDSKLADAALPDAALPDAELSDIAVVDSTIPDDESESGCQMSTQPVMSLWILLLGLLSLVWCRRGGQRSAIQG